MYLASTDEANELLRHDPLALLIGMLLDQQIPMEKAFTSPQQLAQRLAEHGHRKPGPLDAQEIAGFSPEDFEQLFRTPPALHRFPRAMATRVQSLARVLVEDYDGDPEQLWNGADSGKELLRRIAGLPGFGDQKARIFLALLGKQWAVTPPGWRQAAGDYGQQGVSVSIADVMDEPSRQAVRQYKKQQKAKAKQAKDGAAVGLSGDRVAKD